MHNSNTTFFTQNLKEYQAKEQVHISANKKGKKSKTKITHQSSFFWFCIAEKF